MKNIIIFILFFTYSKHYLVYSQANCYEITYKKKPTLATENKKYSSINSSSLIKEAYKEMLKLEYQLVFNNYKSIFYEIETMEVDNITNQFAYLFSRSIGGQDGIFYNNIKDLKMIRQKELSGKILLIEQDLNNGKWNLSQETKKIGKYNCFKATTKIYKETVRGSQEIEAIAWYSDEIPFPFGPANYSGLPGLILEVECQGVLFYAENIKFIKKKCNIDEPKKGQRMNSKEYLEMERNGFDKFR